MHLVWQMGVLQSTITGKKNRILGSQQHPYIALLRGINVGGHSVIKMADLRELFKSFGLSDVSTHIQSGNVLFTSNESNRDTLSTNLERNLESALGYPIRIFLFTADELRNASSKNPFEPERNEHEQLCHILFLSEVPDMDHIESLMAMQGEEYRFHVEGQVLYYAYPRSAAGHRRNINFENVLGVAGTSRSWKVVRKLIELASKL